MSDMAFVDWQRRAARRLPLGSGMRVVRFGAHFVFERPLLTASALFGALGFLVVVSLSAQPVRRPGLLTRPPAKPVASPWVDIIKPIEIFSLDASDFAKAAKTYKARRSMEEGGRQDIITLGAPGTEPALRLSIYRRGMEATPRPPLFAELARQAAEAGLSVTRSGLPDILPTRFGSFEVADVTLSAGAGSALPCSGFRLDLDNPALSMSGLACGGARPTSRKDLGCLLERLDLASGGSDRTLIDFFGRSELKRNATCAGMRLGPDEAHAPWLDDSLPHRAEIHGDMKETSRRIGAG